jgi:hypothetical protein
MSARHRLALPDSTKHCDQHSVDAIGTFDLLFRQDIGEASRDQQYCAILPPAQASMGADERFESGDVERDVIDPAVDVEVGGLWHHDRAAERPGRMVSVRPERIFTGHLTGIEPDTAVRTDRPWHPG